MRHAVIVPSKGAKGIYKDNRTWASQYVAVDKRNRKMISLGGVTPEDVLKASRKAAAWAGKKGEVIYACGHGGAGQQITSGMADLAPNRGFRVSSFLAYYDDKTGTWRGPSIQEMQQEAEKIAKIGRRSKRKPAEKAWCGKYISEGCKAGRRDALALDDLQPHYMELGEIFRENPVKRVNMLTCNVANAEDFLDELSSDLGVPVRGYRVRVVSETVWKGRNKKVVMFLEGDRPGYGTNTDRAATELLPGIKLSQYKTGRVRARPRPQIRRRTRMVPTVPGE